VRISTGASGDSGSSPGWIPSVSPSAAWIPFGEVHYGTSTRSRTRSTTVSVVTFSASAS
jgi:hypothetical protein